MPKAPALCLALGALLLLAGAAQATSVSGSFRSAAPASLSGAVEVAMPQGVARVDDPHATGVVLVHGATGTLRFYSVPGPHVKAVLADPKVATGPSSRPYDLSNATLTLRLADETLAAMLNASAGGALTAQAQVDGSGLPRALERDYAGRDNGTGPSVSGSNPQPPPWGWREGWQVAGNFSRIVGFSGFPLTGPALLGASGPSTVYLFGGNLSFRDAQGAEVDLQLGDAPGDVPAAPIPSERLGADDDKVQWIVFEGTVSDAQVPARASWGMGAPSASWALNGTLSLPHATGSIAGHEFRDAPLSLGGRLALTPSLPAQGVPGVTPVSYGVSGDATVFAIGEASVGLEAPSPAWERPAEVGALSMTALALGWLLGAAGVAGRAVAPLYMRIAPSRLLDHATRRRIYELARERPGIHLRELQRLVGGAWGPLQFHLGLLAQAGLVQMSRVGRYRVVHAGAPHAEVGAPLHPHAQRILDALPQDGRALSVTEIAETLGLSRQLVGHHVGVLERRGLLVVTTAGAGRRLVARPQAPGAAA